jgi:hypothetical protein
MQSDDRTMKRIIVGMSGASGVIYGIRLLEVLKAMDGVETHLVMSRYARLNIEIETSYPLGHRAFQRGQPVGQGGGRDIERATPAGADAAGGAPAHRPLQAAV